MGRKGIKFAFDLFGHIALRKMSLKYVKISEKIFRQEMDTDSQLLVKFLNE